MKKIAVIGSGIAGLTCGIYLKKAGYDVTIFEKNAYAGGFMTTWKRKGCIIDGCIHWLLGSKEGTRLNAIWKEIGGIPFGIYDPEEFCTTEYEGNLFHFYRDMDRFEEELRKYSEGDEEEIRIFMDAIRTIGIIELPSDKPYELMKAGEVHMPMEIMRKMRYYLKINLHELSLRFHSPVIRYALDNCLINRYFSAFYFIQTLSGFMMGNDSIPLGGSDAIRGGLLKTYMDRGGLISYNEPVERFVIENDAVKGVVTPKGTYSFDAVVSAMDPHYLYNHILEGKYENPFDVYDKNSDFHSYSFCIATYRTKKSFEGCDVALVKKVEPYSICGIESDSVSVRQYGYDRSLISEDGYSTVQVYLTTYDKEYDIIKGMSKEEYRDLKKKVGEFYLPYLKEIYDAEFELIDVLTPLTYERYNNTYKGTFMTYTLPPKAGQELHPTRIPSLKGIYLATQWQMLPGGTPIAIVMGKLTAELIHYDETGDYKI